ncbi:MAG TPA: GSCFA domain-containing protein [Pyrinomonadaceae bacterium]|nr:GSCFA domain-containing protein [Pyrinomonadaceae bacterium]
MENFVLQGWLPERPFLNSRTRITAFGSCFAAHLVNYLRQIGYDVARDRHPEIYISSMGEGLVNTYALRQQFEWALEDLEPPENLWYGFRAEEFGYRPEIKERTRKVFLETDFFVITLGLSEVWYDEKTGGVFWRAVPMRLYDPSRHRFRVCSFDETKQNIRRICELIFKHSPQARVLFTLSPIPLAATFRPVSSMTANSASKSILRAALDEFLGENSEILNKKIFYLPSYEIFNELFPNKFTDDNRHPSDDLILFFLKLFEAIYCETPLSLDDVGSLFRETREKNIASLSGAAGSEKPSPLQKSLDVEERVRAVIARLFELSPEEAKGQLRIGNPPRWDSIGHLELLVGIEEEFGIRFPTYEIAGLNTVEAISEAVRAQNGHQSG